MNADGSDVTQLTDHPANDLSPAWSPDGQKIAFTSVRDGYPNIYVMNADGSDMKRLTRRSSGSWWPAWSPDGRRIAFTGGRGEEDIYVINIDGSARTHITNSPARDYFPAWAPGSRIIFNPIARVGQDGFYDFRPHVMDADGSNLRPLPGVIGFPSAWSPDGSRIACGCDRPGGESNSDIYTMNADGSGLTRITTHPSDDDHPTWSPNGLWIAFTSERDGGEDKGDIYIKRLNGGRVIRLTDDDSDETYPAWSPR